MSKRRKITVVKDIVHNYIEITPIEKVMIGNPKFQRLRFVTQNSLAYYTFPSNTNSRFSHSLGVMHLGGKMFKKTIENADEPTLVTFLIEAKSVIENYCGETETDIKKILTIWGEEIGNIGGFNLKGIKDISELKLFPDDPNYKGNIIVDAYSLLNILWQSVRISCVLHDIGHYPLSHLFEEALTQFIANEKESNEVFQEISKIKERFLEKTKIDTKSIKGDIPLHEMNGVNLMLDIFPEGMEDEVLNKLIKVCSRIGKFIFILNKADNSIDKPRFDKMNLMNCLYTIVSSEIDADRLDYCLRDAISSGVELMAIDIDRIIHNLILHIDEDKNEFEIVLKSNALAAIEEFYHQRFQLYKYLIYHHNVVRLNGVMEEVIHRLLKEIVKINESPLRDIYREFGFWNQETPFRKLFSKSFEYYDDNWFRAFLQSIYFKLKEIQNKNYSDLVLLLKIVLYRDLNHIHSLWKREVHVQNTIQRIEEEIDISKDDITLALNLSFETKTQECTIHVKSLNYTLNENGAMLIYGDCTPKIFSSNPKKRVKIIYTGPDQRKVVQFAIELSSYLKSLKTAAENILIPAISFVKEDVGLSKNKNSRYSLIELIENYLSQICISLIK